jgi:hypothetical protein
MPTRTDKTKQDYRDRARQIALTENTAARRTLSPVELVRAVMKRKLRSSSRRQFRAALVFAMTEAAEMQPERAASLNAAIALLRAWHSQKDGDGTTRTSQWKQKNGVEKDTPRICHALLAGTSMNAKALVALLNSTELTGVRFVEWPTATFGPSSVPGYAYELTIGNGKQGNGRSHGETRTLLWKELPDSFIRQLTFWIAIAKAAAAEERYERLRETLEALMRRVTKELFPRRGERPTLSSGRHAAAARFKAAYVATATTEEEKLHGLAMVAALLGHATDATASSHYARAGNGKSRYPVPEPDPAEVARIRRRYSELNHSSKDPSPDTDGTGPA